MSRQLYLDRTRAQLPLARWQHTLRVIETASLLATRYDADAQKVDTASILHDYCKYWTAESLIFAIKRYKLPSDLLLYNQELWHGPVAAMQVQTEFAISDKETITAIFYHTTGRPAMSLVEKIVFLADYIEPARQFPGVDAVRQLAEHQLEQAIALAAKQTIQFLKACGQQVYPLTVDTLAYYENDI